MLRKDQERRQRESDHEQTRVQTLKTQEILLKASKSGHADEVDKHIIELKDLASNIDKQDAVNERERAAA